MAGESNTPLVEFLNDHDILHNLYSYYQRDYDCYYEYFVNKPYVDYIRVHEHFRGQHHSIKLYKKASKFLKKRNMRLRLSRLAGNQALAIREHMKDHLLLEESTIKWYNASETCYLMK